MLGECYFSSLSSLRFYIPSHTWFLQVNISNCRMLERIYDHNSGERMFRWCVRSLFLEARSLPIYNPESGVANLTEGGGYVFTETRPYTDAYYYLLVDTEGETSLDITIQTKGEISYDFPSYLSVSKWFEEPRYYKTYMSAKSCLHLSLFFFSFFQNVAMHSEKQSLTFEKSSQLSTLKLHLNKK